MMRVKAPRGPGSPQPRPPGRDSLGALNETWIDALGPRDRSLLQFILAQEPIRLAIKDGPVVELRATGDDCQHSLLPTAASVTVNSADAAESQASVNGLRNEISLLLVYNALQFLTETRQFLGACFSKLTVGGFMILTVPHQFLYERKLRLPSRRNRLHRRFYTPNTLMADIEEAIDPCEYRVRFLGENDAGYSYQTDLRREPEGGQDIVLALEKLTPPPWRSEMDRDELWTQSATKPTQYIEVDRRAPAKIRTVAPDRRHVGRIILLKLDHRGDFLMGTNAFRLLRNTFKDAEITLACGSWNVAEAKKIALFDKIIPFDFFPEDDSSRLETQPRETLTKNFAKQISGNAYDLAVDCRLYDDTRAILRVIKARNRAGFDRYDLFPWLSIRLNTPSATVDDRAETGVITANHFHASVGKHRTFEIEADAPRSPQAGKAAIWGPYQELKPGRYQFECLIDPLDEEFEVPFDIVCDSGTRTIFAGVMPVSRKQYPHLDFQVDNKIEQFEFRIIGKAPFELKPFRFKGIRYVRESVIRGVHQSEAMSLLAHLIQLRLQNAYTTELL